MATTIQTRAYTKKMVSQDKDIIVKRNIRYSTITADQLVDAASRNSQVGKGVLRAAFEAVLNEFENFLLNGHNVELPGIGYFGFGLKCKAPTDEEEAGAASIVRRKVKFTPCTALKAELNAISFENVNDDEFAEGEEENEGTEIV